ALAAPSVPLRRLIGEILYVEPDVVHDRPHSATGWVLLSQVDKHSGKLHHLDLPVMDQRAAYLSPEALLRRDVARIHVNMSDRYAHGVGGSELRGQRRDTE